VRGGSSPLSSEIFLPLPLSEAFLLLLTGQCCFSCRPPCLFTVHLESGSSLLHSHKLPHSWLLGARPAPARGSPAHRLVYLQSREGFPSPNLQHSGRPTLFPACLKCSYFLLLSFSFFPGWRSVCPGGYAALAQACLWGYRGTTKLTWSTSSQAVSQFLNIILLTCLSRSHKNKTSIHSQIHS
jgi:hypothetical protein